MSKRLQVLFEEEELEQIRGMARRNHMTVAEWVRQSLRRSMEEEPRTEVETKLAAIEEAFAHEFPAGDIDQMLSEIESGYLQGAPEIT